MAGIPSIPKINRFLTSVSAFGQADPAAAYIAAITSAGATVTAPKQAAISAFISGEIAAGRWDGHKRIYFPVWGVAAANAICMKSLTSGTFVGAVTHGAGYVTTPTITGGYMDTNTTLGAIGISKDTYHFAVLEKVTGYGGDGVRDSRFGNVNVNYSFNDGNPEINLGEENIGIPTAAHPLISFFGNASSRIIKKRATSGVTTIETNAQIVSTAFSNTSILFLKWIAGDYSSRTQIGAFTMGLTMSDADDTAYTTALKTLWETTTGLTLP